MSKKEKNEVTQDDDFKERYAKCYIKPTTQAASTICSIKHSEEPLDVIALMDELNRQVNLCIEKGSLNRAENMLLSQAHVLDLLFNKQVKKAMNQDYLNQFKVSMDIALKAQRQCRATLETLSAIKNPRPYIQNNSANYQQVNNGNTPSKEKNPTDTHTPARAGENLKQANELLEHSQHEQEWMDGGTPQETIGNDKAMATVEK